MPESRTFTTTANTEDPPHSSTRHPEPGEGNRVRVRKRLPDNFTGLTGASILALLLANLVLWFGGGVPPVSQALLTIGIGVLIVLFPPRHSHSWPATAACLGLFLLPALGFLPASWLGLPSWRLGLEENLGINVGDLLSPQPWVTLEAWLIFSVALLFFHYCSCRKWKDGDRVLLMFGLWLTLVALMLVSFAFNQFDHVPAWWDQPGRQLNFGPFANRNHTACLTAVGAVLAAACGYDLFRRKSRFWLLPVASIVLFLAAAFLVKSRAGVLLLFGGLGIWMFVTAWQSRSVVRLAIAGSGLLGLVAIGLIFGKGALDRFTFDGDTPIESIQMDGRIPIYFDTLEQIVRHPVAGVGLGNFEPVFALTQSRSIRMERNLHPESSWLKFTMEVGVLGLILGLFLLWEITRRMNVRRRLKNKSRRRHRRLRFGAAVAGLVVVVHGIIDMPLHIPGTAFIGVLLLGLAISQKQQESSNHPLFTNIYRALGAGALAIGLVLLANGTGAFILPGSTPAKIAIDEANRAWSAGEDERAFASLNRAIEAEPMNWQAHFARATITLETGGSHLLAQQDFRRARHLEPHAPEVPWQESKAWLRHDPMKALPAWREVLRRDQTRRHEYYGLMLRAAKDDERLLQATFDLASMDGRLRLMVMRQLPEAEFRKDLAQLLEIDPELDLLTSKQRRDLFQLWANRGDKEALLEELADNPYWLEDGWRIVADDAARQGEFRRAFELAEENTVAPPIPTVPGGQSLRELERDFRMNPTDMATGVLLFLSQRENRRYDEALETLDRIRRLGEPPLYLDYEEAMLHAEMENWQQGLEILLRIDRETSG